ncbi:MAG TPA: imidazolonepropionase [Anaerolineaceae bacterium]|nr:imidazolonepropionase [Anaerolineaceae bacterium]HOG79180.1 imidazolonepropionase [Anaerolineaceae bacterium]
MNTLLIHSASQVLTLAGGPQRGHELGRLSLIEDGAVLIEGETIAAVGRSAELLAAYPKTPQLNAGGRAMLPGFVDPHTHLIWAGDRAAEFELRLQGKTYLEILAAGGGILSTVRATRTASLDELKAQTRRRAHALLAHGTTTAEAKTGYGLDHDSELVQLQALLELDEEGPLELAPTYLGAHAIAPEYRDDPDGYTRLLCKQMLPAVRDWWARHAANRPLPFVDVFCETGAFTLAQSREILETAKSLGFPLKIHADEFDNLGGASLAAELGAASADHLVKTSPEDITALAQSNTVAVSLPCTPFGLADPHYTPARAILEANGLLALATDINPGTAWCENMQFAIALGCRYLRLTPAQAIAAATINSAAAIGRADRIGSIEVGKQADLILLQEPDYRHLGYRFGANLVQTVIKRGKVVVDHANH